MSGRRQGGSPAAPAAVGPAVTGGAMNTAGEQAMSDRLVRVETKLDLMITRLDPSLLDHEMRIRKLERAIWAWSGVAAAGGGVLGSILGPLIGG